MENNKGFEIKITEWTGKKLVIFAETFGAAMTLLEAQKNVAKYSMRFMG